MARRTALHVTSDTLTPGLKAFSPKMNDAVARTMDFFEPRVESYARTNAPWTDRSANARNGLKAHAIHEGNRRHAIELAHSVPYGIWLEIRFEGKYAIIIPTIETMGRELMSVLRGLLGRMH